MDKEYIKNYWKEVRRQAWVSAWDKSGMKIIIPFLVVIFGSIALGGLLLMFGWVGYPFFKDNLVANFLTGLSQLLFSIAILVYLFFSLLSQTPPKIHKEQENDKKTLEAEKNKKIEILQKDIQALKSKLERPILNEGLDVYTHNEDKRVGVQIFNSTLNNLSSLKVHLTHLTLTPYFGGKNEDYLFKIKANNYFFNLGDNFNKDHGIDKSDYVFIYLAEMQNNNLVFLLKEPFLVENYENVRSETNVENHIAVFEIELLITGDDVNNNQLRLATFKGLITYNLYVTWRTQIGKEELKDMGDKPIVEIYVEKFDIQEVKDEQADQKENPKSSKDAL